MSIHFDVILRRNTAPELLAALGAALWHWSSITAGATGIYQYVDNQALADLIAGKVPASSGRGVHFRTWDQTSPNRQAAIDNLRWALPGHWVEDVVVDGKGWELE